MNKPGVLILDARASKFYTGEEAGRMPRGVHIPSAENIPFDSVVEDSNKFKSVESLRQLFNSAGVKAGDSITTYCHIGQQASLLYFVARYLGYDAHLYDGSFEDWTRRPELPVEKSSGTPQLTKPNPPHAKHLFSSHFLRSRLHTSKVYLPSNQRAISSIVIS